MSLSVQQQQLVKDYFVFHLNSPLNSQPDDYHRFNKHLFRAIKLNFMYTLATGVLAHRVLFSRASGVFRGLVSPGLGALGLCVFAWIQFQGRLQAELFNETTLGLAQRYAVQVAEYNDHYRRIHGNL